MSDRDAVSAGRGGREATSDSAPGTILILGASSMIARATALAFAAEGYDLALAGRSLDEVERVAADVRTRFGVDAFAERFDALDTESHAEFVERITERANDLIGAVVAFGSLGDADRARADFEHARELISTNYLGAASALTHLANYFEARKDGFIVGISSVAGDRGRQTNYVYGSAKGGLSLFLQGLRNRLHPVGVKVITVKPGFVDTRMTFGKIRPGLAAPPEAVAAAIVRAVRRGRSTVYVPWPWRYVMLAIRLIPESLFKRLRL